MNIKTIFGVKYLITIFASMGETIWEMNALNMFHEVPLLIILFSTKSATELGPIKTVHFGDVVLQVHIPIIP